MRVMDILGPVTIALLYISLCSLFKEPSRRNFNAIMIAGAGAAYLNGGFGIWEFAFLIVVTYCAYQGLRSYRFIDVGWLLHTSWDVMLTFTGIRITFTGILSFRSFQSRHWDAPFAIR
jgi:hypothetical protein